MESGQNVCINWSFSSSTYGPLENFPYYNQTTKKCLYDYAYCGKRNEAKYHNHQCFSGYDVYNIYSRANPVIGFQCLNRKDISENFVRNSVNYESFVSTRRNLFQYFKANDTRNQVTKTEIICDYQKIDMDCSDRKSTIKCKKEKRDNDGIYLTNTDVCDALDLLEDKGLPAPSAFYTRHIYASPQELGM